MILPIYATRRESLLFLCSSSGQPHLISLYSKVMLLLSRCWVPMVLVKWWLGDNVIEQGCTSPSISRCLHPLPAEKYHVCRDISGGYVMVKTSLAWRHLNIAMAHWCRMVHSWCYPRRPTCSHGQHELCCQAEGALFGYGSHWIGVHSFGKEKVDGITIPKFLV
jgi:hypothetical protein